MIDQETLDRIALELLRQHRDLTRQKRAIQGQIEEILRDLRRLEQKRHRFVATSPN